MPEPVVTPPVVETAPVAPVTEAAPAHAVEAAAPAVVPVAASHEHVGTDHSHSAMYSEAAHADSASAHTGGHHAFSIQASMLHHNMPYPAWEPIHGKPLLVFDLGTYAAMNLDTLKADPAFATQDATTNLPWATDVTAVGDFRFDAKSIKPSELAQAMSLVQQQTPVFPRALSFLNQQLFFGLVALSLLFIVVGILFRRKPDQIKPQGRIQHALEALVVTLRDTVVRPNIHGHADGWVPFFVSIFLMILAVNLMGLIPGAGTMSGNIGVTGAFAGVILLLMLGMGMKEQGVAFWPNLVPIHFSLAMSPVWLLLLVIEMLGLIIKPFALALRLFANMFAGHTVLLVFLSLAYVIIGAQHDAVGLASGLGVAGFLMTCGFYFMELLVAFIQAYVFTMLSAMFIGAAMHPEH